ncbi:hypothetical protein [Methyloglobulus sp.]
MKNPAKSKRPGKTGGHGPKGSQHQYAETAVKKMPLPLEADA